MSRSLAHPLALTCLVALPALRCMSYSTTGRSTIPDANVVTEAEIVAAQATSIYEVLERVRPRFITTRIDLSPQMERQVYLDGTRLGGLEQLRRIPALAIHEIRFSRSVDGSGVGDGGAVILLISKPAR